MVTLALLLLGQQSKIESLPRWLVTMESEAGSKRKRIVAKSYRLVGTSNLRPQFSEQITVPSISGGGGPYIVLSPTAPKWARVVVDQEQRNSTISVWSVNPLRLVTRRSQGWITDARWLYQGNSLAIVSEENERPTATLISGEDGRVLYRFDGCLGVLDHPKRRGAVRVRTDMKLKEFEELARIGLHSFEPSIKSGRIWAEETSDFRQWQKVDALAATHRWIFSEANKSFFLIFPFSTGSLTQTVFGFKEHWLIRFAETAPPKEGEARGSVKDRLMLANRKSLTYLRRDVQNGKELFAVSSIGEMLISGTANMDYSIPQRKGYQPGPTPLLGVRVDLGGTKRFRIKNPVLLGSTIVLWSP